MDLFNKKKVDKLVKMTNSLQRDLDDASKDLDILREVNEDNKITINILGSNLSQASNDLLTANEDNKDKETRIKELEIGVKTIKDNLLAVIKENETLKECQRTNLIKYLSTQLVQIKNSRVITSLQAGLIESKNSLRAVNEENKRYKEMLTDDYGKAVNLSQKIKILDDREKGLSISIAAKQRLISALDTEKSQLTDEVIELRETKLLQDFNLYEPMYDFSTSCEFKEKLVEIRNEQKEMIKEKTAVTCNTEWTVGGSKRLGNKLTRDTIKQALMIFNTECESVIDRVTFSNFDSMNLRIDKLYDKLNKLNSTQDISISYQFLKLKKEELALAYEYKVIKQKEKEELRVQREIQRENAKVAKELEEERRKIEKEQQHYNNVMTNLLEQIEVEKNEQRLMFLCDKKRDIEKDLVRLVKVLSDIDYREANQRAGYVYVISNIGAFGENIYKIGMTRRLDPKVRIDELGGASVPFRFDIHAMIFSDDAPRLESTLHNTFENRRVNAVNNRKEFFNLTLEEIEEVVKKNHDRTVEFVHLSQAQQFRETVRVRTSQSITSI